MCLERHCNTVVQIVRIIYVLKRLNKFNLKFKMRPRFHFSVSCLNWQVSNLAVFMSCFLLVSFPQVHFLALDIYILAVQHIWPQQMLDLSKTSSVPNLFFLKLGN